MSMIISTVLNHLSVNFINSYPTKLNPKNKMKRMILFSISGLTAHLGVTDKIFFYVSKTFGKRIFLLTMFTLYF